jgi:hypothetical protein
MKNSTKKIMLTVILLTTISFASNGQTPVSGGIYSNTTWALSNSPYIVTDTVVVFPGVILTIEPGVVVKFDTNTRLEIRAGQLIAEGTPTDSITFTSNLLTPSPGSWLGIVLDGYISSSLTSKFKYCNIRFANKAIYGGNLDGNLNIKNTMIDHNNYGIECSQNNNIIDSCLFTHNVYYAAHNIVSGTVSNTSVVYNGGGFLASSITFQNCIFRFNQGAIDPYQCKIYGCIINNNTTGMSLDHGYNVIKNCVIDSNSNYGIVGGLVEDTVSYCSFRHNGTGLYIYSSNTANNFITNNEFEFNATGVMIANTYDNFHCNKICNNTTYDVNYNAVFGSNINLSNNYWGTTDSTLITSHIYDGYDNINLGLVVFMPIDTTQCYLNSSCSSNFYLYPDSLVPHQYYAINLALGAPPLTYLWSWDDGSYSSNPYPSHTYSTAGFYNICLTITDINGCSSTFCDSSYLSKNTNSIIYVNVISPTGIKENKENKTFSIFPNPANEQLTVRLFKYETKGEIKIYNLLGQQYSTLTISGTETTIDVTDLSKGVYIIDVTMDDKIYRQKFIKE